VNSSLLQTSPYGTISVTGEEATGDSNCFYASIDLNNSGKMNLGYALDGAKSVTLSITSGVYSTSNSTIGLYMSGTGIANTLITWTGSLYTYGTVNEWNFSSTAVAEISGSTNLTFNNATENYIISNPSSYVNWNCQTVKGAGTVGLTDNIGTSNQTFSVTGHGGPVNFFTTPGFSKVSGQFPQGTINGGMWFAGESLGTDANFQYLQFTW
jgi:hypothetical protein